MIKRFFFCWEFFLLLMLIIEFIVFGVISPRFLKLSNLLYSTGDFSQIGIVALPLTIVIITGGIDVSFASTIGLCAITFGVSNYFGHSLLYSVALSLFVGLLTGAFNAGIIHFSKIQPLVVTLGSLYLFKGIATVLSGAVGTGGYEGIGGFPSIFTNFTYITLFGLPMPFVLLLAETICLLVFLHFSRMGRYVFLCGLNENAARYSGLPLRRTQTATYMLTGFFSAILGLVLSSYFGSARVDLGSTMLLPAITAVVLGGASIYGGKGSIIGTFLATLVIGYLQQGLQMSGVLNQVSNALSGALLVIVISLRQGGALLVDFIAMRIVMGKRKYTKL